MQYQQSGNDVVIRLDIGDEVLQSIGEVCQKLHVKCATIQGIGATGEFAFGFFNPHTKDYLLHTYNEDAEIVSLLGNVTQKDGATYLHIHASFGLENGTVVGGHLNKAVISVTCEIFLHNVSFDLGRKMGEVGVNVIKFDN